MIEDPDRCYEAAKSKDARFDGWFFCGVTSTGIYCRPSCPARTPKRENMRFYATAAAAQQAGFRACLRCRPDATPGSPEWNNRADVVARADASDPGRHRRPRGRRGTVPPVGLQHASAQPPDHRRGGQRSARARARPAQPDGPGPAGDDGAAGDPHCVRGGLRQRQAVQRHRPPGLRRHAQRSARRGRRGPHAGGSLRLGPRHRASACASPAVSRSTRHRSSPSWASARSPRSSRSRTGRTHARCACPTGTAS